MLVHGHMHKLWQLHSSHCYHLWTGKRPEHSTWACPLWPLHRLQAMLPYIECLAVPCSQQYFRDPPRRAGSADQPDTAGVWQQPADRLHPTCAVCRAHAAHHSQSGEHPPSLHSCGVNTSESSCMPCHTLYIHSGPARLPCTAFLWHAWTSAPCKQAAGKDLACSAHSCQQTYALWHALGCAGLRAGWCEGA